ncbi:helix-turn-helix domain-containing protein [Streptomyces zingiberis]|uniref:PucR family transcriptional regulator n=1 Tax=Streptomyces zingiberis TaxID=2053010 RepID=A0ABX1BPR7_9ACTN|nr:helix-turn-helix domain-containing protein [Streptomyces zingiberis]NJP99716.1 PucR family transcriptional regulator [Streptomyces zingiberis]
MKGLLLRLSALDADAAGAVRVIAHFEALMGAGPDAVALVRSTAGLARCPAGLESSDGRTVRFGPGGAALPGPPARISGSARFGGGDAGPAGRVWLERPGPPGPFDDLVLEWMALAARTLHGGRRAGEPPHAADPALVELVLSEREAVADRARALRLLGLVPELPLRVVAVALAVRPADGRGGAPPGGRAVLPTARAAGTGRPGPDVGVATVALLGRSALRSAARIARLGPLGAVLVQDPDGGATSPARELRAAAATRAGAPAPSAGGPARAAGRAGGARGAGGAGRAVGAGGPGSTAGTGGIRAGVGGRVDALGAGVSWRQARAALRFTVAGAPEEAVADHDELGPAALLAEIPAERLRERPEVRALAAFAATEGGRTGIAALAAVCHTGSLRQAAAELHLHHSSVAARLAQVEDALGWQLREPGHRFHAQLALYAWRLAEAPD